MNHKDNKNLACNDIEFIMREIWARTHKNSIIKYLEKSQDENVKSITNYLKKNSISVFPYDFIKKYSPSNVDIFKDNNTGLFYVNNKNGDKLFLKKKYTSEFRAKRYYSNILMEQDDNSPHKYMSDNYIPDQNTVIIDIGGAEGFFSLEYIKTIKHAYIFECDADWVEALKKTFEPYMDKITIIDKFVSNFDDNNHITLDTFFDKNDLKDCKSLIKIDAEANEIDILDGGKKYFASDAKCDVLVCSYHKNDDEAKIKEKLKGFTFEPSSGYMLYYYDYDISEPYLRTGLLRCKKD